MTVLQGSVGETDSKQTSPLGAPHHLHWAYQEPPVQVLESWVCALCTRDREVSNRTCAKLVWFICHICQAYRSGSDYHLKNE